MIRNTAFNAIGLGLPLLIGLFVFPELIREMGGERFGLLTLIWTMVGYFNLFDLGISRALTRLLSIEFAREGDNILNIVASGLLLLLLLGLLVGVTLFYTSGTVLESLYSKDSAYFSEANGALDWISLTLPFILISSGCVGILESLGKYLTLNLIRAALGALVFLVPLFAFRLTGDLADVAFGLLWLRIAYCFVVTIFALKPLLRYNTGCFTSAHFKDLFSFGAWITLSNIIGPIMLYGDRFLVASMSGVVVSGYYGVSLEILTKILIIPSAVLSSTFPIFSKILVDRESSQKAYWSALRITTISVFIIIILVFIFGQALSSKWMGQDFSNIFSSILSFVLAGILFNSIGLVAQGFVQAANRPDLTAKLHVAELILYLPYAYWLILEFSVIGAAMAWALRTFLSMITLIYLSVRVIRDV